MVNVMPPSEILLTAADLRSWREENRQIDEQINALQQKQGELRRKIEAAEVFVQATAGTEAEASETPAKPESKGNDAGEGLESPPAVLLANLRKTGDSLNVQGIKKRLIELGFGDRVRDRPNYHYDLAYRLSNGKYPKLIKRGSKYRAAPISSPEGETEAVGASVRH